MKTETPTTTAPCHTKESNAREGRCLFLKKLGKALTEITAALLITFTIAGLFDITNVATQVATTLSAILAISILEKYFLPLPADKGQKGD